MDNNNNKGFRIVENHESESGSKSSNIKLWVVLLFLLTIVCSFLAGNLIPFSVLGDKVASTSTNTSYAQEEELRKKLKDNYFGEVTDEMLTKGALKGMAAILGDPYTVYMDKDEYKDFNNQTEGEYVGLGIQVGVKDEKITVISTFDNSPAKEAGVLQGDVILKVDNNAVSVDSLEKATAMMKGKENTDVTVTFSREGKGEFDVKMTRKLIELVSVEGEMLDNNIGYIKLKSFDDKSGKDFDAQMDKLRSKDMKGLVLDLRGNPGGLLSSCGQIASNFIKKDNVILTMKDKNGNEKTYKSQGGKSIGLPLVVLIDGGSASASEVLSGALRDYKAAELVGEKSFGKGIVQDLFPLKDEAGLKVTVYQYFTPNGENIHKKGIEPDVKVVYPEDLKSKTYDRSTDPQFSKALEEINVLIKK